MWAVIGPLVGRFWPYLLALGVLTYGYFYIRGAERAKDALELAERRMLAAEVAASQNQVEFEQCLSVNRRNADAAEAERLRAEAAIARVKELERATDTRVEEIAHEADTLRAAGLDCPAIDGDFRRWMLNRSP